MWKDLVFRFFFGGAIISLFAVLGDVLRPKSFAGLLGAAPSVALASLGLTILKEDDFYVAAEGRSMIAGAVALGIYCQVLSCLLMRHRAHALGATLLAIVLWLGVAFGLYFLILK